MDDIPDVVVRVIDQLIWAVDEEFRLLEEIILDEEENEIEQRGGGDDVGHVLNEMIGEMLRFEIIQIGLEEMEVEEQLIYNQNPRLIDWRANLPRMQYIRTLEDPTFANHFRMNRHAFELLIVEFGNHLVSQNRLIRLRTEVDKCLLMGLWILFNIDTFRSAGVVFSVPRSVIHFHYLVLIEALRELAPKFIKWPTTYQRDCIKAHCDAQSGYPGIIGFLDGTLIKITAPVIQRQRYIDRHHSYSVNVQAVCDSNLVFTDVYVGEPGSVHDSRAFRRSPLHDLLLERPDLIRRDEHILADGAYTNTDKVLKPYRDNGHLTERERWFNRIHSGNRMAIERAFGRLKGKMRRLMTLFVRRFEYALDHIIASFVLHNFILLDGVEADGVCINQHQAQRRIVQENDMNEENVNEQGIGQESDDDDDNENNDNDEEINDGIHPLLQVAKLQGTRKRNYIADKLFLRMPMREDN